MRTKSRRRLLQVAEAVAAVTVVVHRISRRQQGTTDRTPGVASAIAVVAETRVVAEIRGKVVGTMPRGVAVQLVRPLQLPMRKRLLTTRMKTRTLQKPVSREPVAAD